MRSWLAIAAVLAAASAFTIHQHSSKQECVDLQCPATSFDYGKKSLVNEETLKSEPCRSCHQCTANGYSVCMRSRSSRARRQSETAECSCAHSVPANCHNELSNNRHPSNMTMQIYNICYVSALQAPPKPLAVNDKESVIVTIEPFWQEPYWREVELQNLTLHYDYEVKVPEHCDGTLVTNEDEHGLSANHLCLNSLQIEMTTSDKTGEDEYEHSENYDQYDDDLPPEVVFDREVFMGAKNSKIFFDVEVKRPRQLKIRSASNDVFEDQLTKVESEVLKFDLKPDVFGTGIKDELPKPHTEEESSEAKDEKVSPTLTETKVQVNEEDDVSEEQEGTDFFHDTRKETKSEEVEEKEEEELAEKVEKEEKEEEHSDVVEDHTHETADNHEEEEKETAEVHKEELPKETKDDESEKNEDEHHAEEDKKEEEKEKSVEEDKEEEKDEKEVEKEEEKEEQEDEKEMEEDEDDDEDDEETNDEETDATKVINDAVDDNEEAKEEADGDEKKSEEDEEETEKTTDQAEDSEHEESATDENVEASGDDKDDDVEEDLGFFANLRERLANDKIHLAKWVFGITIVGCLFFICAVCVCRRCRTKKQNLTKSANGNRYEAAPQNTQLVSHERMKLNQ